MTDLNVKGMALADGVVETIIAIALKDVDGVASIGGTSAAGILSVLQSKPATAGIEVAPTDDGAIAVVVHITARFGAVLPELAATVRQTIADAVLMQVGLTVSSVEVFIDAIVFE